MYLPASVFDELSSLGTLVMVLIVTEEGDQSSNQVCEWLRFYNKDFIRVNTTETLDLIELTVSHVILKKGNVLIDSREVHGYWYRRGCISININTIPSSGNEGKDELINKLNHSIRLEHKEIAYYVHRLFEFSVNTLGSFMRYSVNKLEFLRVAKKLGLNVPNTAVLGNKKHIIRHFAQGSSLVTKSMYAPFTYELPNTHIATFTSQVQIDALGEFGLSLFQEEIYKQYEIRVFYLRGALYSMAIFSQFDEQTKVDYRKYNDIKPNKTIRYSLPKYIADQVKNLMHELGLDTGSLDIIRSIDGHYYFLEVNPVGQFGMVSEPCNYGLERLIAEYLIS